MDFRLKIFCDAAEHGSFTKAAQLNFITQPAVTKNIKELEADLGISLFERKNARVTLTQAGSVYYKQALHILSLYDEAKFKVEELKGEFSGELKIGASTTIGQYVLPEVLAAFNAKYPQVNISMENANTEEIEKSVQEGKVSLGFIEGQSNKVSLKYEVVQKDELVAVVSALNPLASRDEISIADLIQQNIVLRETGSGSLDIILDYLKRSKVKVSELRVKAHLGSSESIKRYLAYNDCVGFLSIHAVDQELLSGKLKVLEVKGLEIKRNFYAVYPFGNFDGLAKLFLEFFQNYNEK